LLLFFALACCVLSNVPTLADNAPKPLAPDKFEEFFLDAVPVSGTVLVGAQFSDAPINITEALWALLPQTESGRLCISILSDDGRYNAKAEYLLSDHHVGEQFLLLPTKKQRELMQYGSGRLALLATIKTSCQGEDLKAALNYIPLSWGRPVSVARISILVNAGDADVRLFNSSTRSYSGCTKLEDTNRSKTHVAFDTSCEIATTPNMREWRGYITRVQFDATLPQIPLFLRLHE
jgi:hypothetical protein